MWLSPNLFRQYPVQLEYVIFKEKLHMLVLVQKLLEVNWAIYFLDVNECRQNPNICGGSGRCVNTVGGYYCINGVSRGKENILPLLVKSNSSIGIPIMSKTGRPKFTNSRRVGFVDKVECATFLQNASWKYNLDAGGRARWKAGWKGCALDPLTMPMEVWKSLSYCP